MWYVQVHECVYRSTFGIQLYFLANVQRCREGRVVLRDMSSCRAYAARRVFVFSHARPCSTPGCFMHVKPAAFSRPRRASPARRALAPILRLPISGCRVVLAGAGSRVEFLAVASTTSVCLQIRVHSAFRDSNSGAGLKARR